jgi:hypothetical protein
VRARIRVPWEVLKRRITEQDGPHAGHVEDQPFADERPPAEFVDLPFGYVVAISFEEQPAGVCLHVSVSGPWPRVAPSMVICAMIFNALDVPDEAEGVWTEEFLIDGKPGGRVLNAQRSPPAAGDVRSDAARLVARQEPRCPSSPWLMVALEIGLQIARRYCPFVRAFGC